MDKELTAEQQNAISIVLGAIDNWADQLYDCTNKVNSVQTNYLGFSKTPIKREHLPRESHWVWNQSNAKVKTVVNNLEITLQKFNARKKPKSTIRQPSLKIWIYSIMNHTEFPIYCIWCERGRVDTSEATLVGILTPIGRIRPESITIESLSFLSEFAEQDFSFEIGWLQN